MTTNNKNFNVKNGLSVDNTEVIDSQGHARFASVSLFSGEPIGGGGGMSGNVSSTPINVGTVISLTDNTVISDITYTSEQSYADHSWMNLNIQEMVGPNMEDKLNFNNDWFGQSMDDFASKFTPGGIFEILFDFYGTTFSNTYQVVDFPYGRTGLGSNFPVFVNYISSSNGNKATTYTPNYYNPIWTIPNILGIVFKNVSTTYYNAELNSPAVPLTPNNVLLFNGNSSETNPTLLSANGSAIVDSVNLNFNPSTNYNSDLVLWDWAAGLTNSSFNLVMTDGARVTLNAYSTITGSQFDCVFDVVSVTKTAMNFTANTQYVSGYNIFYENDSSWTNSIFPWTMSATIPIKTTYSNFITTNYTSANANSYIATVPFEKLSVGTQIGYLPPEAKLTFSGGLSGNTKSISFSNINGDIKYDGIKIDFTSNTVGNSVYSSATTSTATHAVNLGFASTAGDYSIALGEFAGALAQSVAIGPNAIAYTDGVCIGQSSQAMAESVVVGKSAFASDFGVSIGYSSAANGPYSTAIGPYAIAQGSNMFAYAGTGSPSNRNQSLITQWSCDNVTGNGISYIPLAFNSSTSPYQTTSNYYAIYCPQLLDNSNQRVMAYCKANILIKPTGDQYNDDVVVLEKRFILKTNGTNSYQIVQPASNTTVLYAGSGTQHNTWNAGFEIYNNNYLLFFVNKGSSTINFGVSAKLYADVLQTA